MKEITKEQKKVIADLQASDPKIVIAAIAENRKIGNAATFKEMLNTLKVTDEPTVETSIIQFLYDLKDEESIPILIDAIEDEEMTYYHSFLVATFWQSAIDGSDHLETFVKTAINGEYMTALESLTVVENFDSSFNQDVLAELEADISIALETEENEDKKMLLTSLGDVIRNLPIEGE